MALPDHRYIDILFACVYPILWSLAIITFSGDLGSYENTQYILHWVISWFSAPSPGAVSFINLCLRKIGHVFSYGLLYFLWFQAFHRDLGLQRRSACLYAMGLCLGLAILDEGRQSFYPSRGPSLWDVALDVTGAALAAGLSVALGIPQTQSLDSRPTKTRLL